MSDLYRSSMQARIAKLPDLASLGIEDNDEDEEEEEENDNLSALPGSGLGPPAMPAMTRHPRAKGTPNPAFAPISAAEYFTSASVVDVGPLSIRVYYTPPATAGNGAGSVLVCHHGAGYAGLSFAAFAREVRDVTRGELGVLAFDARRHGKTTSTQDDADLSIDVLTHDLVGLLKSVFPDPKTCPTFFLVGHSMGGAVCTRSCPALLDAKYPVGGIIVLDVVEGTALDALPHMMSILNARPDGFGSVEQAVEWHVTTNTIRNPASARVSIPAIVRPSSTPGSNHAYEWRTPLRSTAPYWTSWFTGLSSSFLAARTARLLILAGADRLDRELMIGQMQGKFQMSVVAGVGHMLHEDDPKKLAEVVIEFWRRNERVVPGVKKVGEI